MPVSSGKISIPGITGVVAAPGICLTGNIFVSEGPTPYPGTEGPAPYPGTDGPAPYPSLRNKSDTIGVPITAAVPAAPAPINAFPKRPFFAAGAAVVAKGAAACTAPATTGATAGATV